jgi:hypothetical protein
VVIHAEAASFQPLESLEAALRRGRNADGGWGYYAGKSSRLEPTCWALLALGDADPQVLRNWPVHDGLLLERAGGEPNYGFHGLGMLALTDRRLEHAAGNGALLAAIQRVKGITLAESNINRQDNSIQGWSWIDGTFSWVEPTAWCLLALKKSRAAFPKQIEPKRIADAEALLADRCCRTGGWNYGNANMLGQELPAYIPTTAAALLSLQDRPSDDAVVRSRGYLLREGTSEKSAVALSLAVAGLRVLRQPTDAVQSALLGQLPTTIALGNQCAQALALYALRKDHHDAALTL